MAKSHLKLCGIIYVYCILCQQLHLKHRYLPTDISGNLIFFAKIGILNQIWRSQMHGASLYQSQTFSYLSNFFDLCENKYTFVLSCIYNGIEFLSGGMEQPRSQTHQKLRPGYQTNTYGHIKERQYRYCRYNIILIPKYYLPNQY